MRIPEYFGHLPDCYRIFLPPLSGSASGCGRSHSALGFAFLAYLKTSGKGEAAYFRTPSGRICQEIMFYSLPKTECRRTVKTEEGGMA